MPFIPTRSWLAGTALSLAFCSARAPVRPPLPASSPGHTSTTEHASARPIVGAIRWDAWTGDAPGHDVGLQVEHSLGPKKWHERLPFFAEEVSDTEVRVRANTQSVMDREIAYARAAGIDYWAFVMYAQDDPATTGGVDLYLRSERRQGVRFAMIVQPYTFADGDIARLVGYFALSEYETVAGGRPLVFLLGPESKRDPAWHDVQGSVHKLRERAAAAGSKAPYLVHLWGWSHAKEVVDWLGLDAMSAYSLNFDDEAAPYATLATKAQEKWDEWRSTGARVVPLVMAGWDRRPRVEHPVSWEGPNKPNALSLYYAAPTPAELATHLETAIEWCQRHPESADAQAVLVYAWNEFDEGGWLAPSLWPQIGTQRLDAIHRVLATGERPSRADF